MAWTFNPFSGTFDQKGSGGGGASYIDGEVATYADLPLDGTATLNSAWLVRTASGVWPVTRKQAGIYIRTATGGSNRDSDYTYAGTMPDVFSDSQFLLYDNSDTSKNLAFDLGSITTGTTRTLTAPNASGRIQVEGQPIGNTTPSTGSFTTLSAAPTSGSALTLTGGTVTASAPLIDATQTWNNAAVTFAGLRLNATNTASATASLLADFQVGGATQFSIRRDGSSLGNYYRFTNLDAGMWVHSVGGQEVAFGASPNHWFTMTSTRLRLAGDVSLGRSGSAGQAVDCVLVRDDAGVLAQRNAANAQTFRLYSTFTSTTNFERLNIIAQSAGSVIIGTEKGSGGGTARGMEFRTDNVARISIGSAGQIGFFGATAAAQPTAVADATDAASVITQLNALLSRLRTLGLIAT